MIRDFRQPRDLELPRDAVVVVGSGAAGIALALTLGDRGRPVVLLESGGDVKSLGSIEDSAHLNEGVLEGQFFGGLQQGRARVLGGTTQLWDGQCMRLHDIDFCNRPWVPRSGWPLSVSDLDAHYAAAEEWLDVSGRGYAEDRWSDYPQLPPLHWNPDHLLHTFTEYSRQPYLGTKHRDRLARHADVRVLVHATVGQVHVKDDQVCHVEILDTSGRRARIDAKTVVLAAGTIENTRLLQLSDPDGLGLGLGREHTGSYLQDHPIIRTAEIFPTDYRVLQDRYVGLWKEKRRLFPKVRLSPKAQERHGLLDAAGVFEHDHDRASLDAARRLLLAARKGKRPPNSAKDVALASRAAPAILRAFYRRNVKGLYSFGGRPSHVWLQAWVEQAPKRERRVTLADSRDALGLRQPAVRWSCEPEELKTSRQLTRWISDDLSRLGVARVRELPTMTDDDTWRASVRDGFHPAGTTRMARNPQEGVVDTELQVHGVHGLFVVGGSVFPTSGYGNPTLTIVALALRLAEHLERLTH